MELILGVTDNNHFPATGDLRCVLINFANSLDPDQARHIVGPDLIQTNGTPERFVFDESDENHTKFPAHK